ncbi:MAG: tetratricopeptide repeat protein, partial [Methylobacteriaceae bacterium]|nr:tetratricopeptide repeat protein [Methylobacteriaceae bacterium]
MMFAEIEGLLKRTAGLDPASVSPSAIERAVKARLSACNLPDPRAYCERLQGSKAELQELIEALVVPETWFFRDREAFAAMVRTAVAEWLPGHAEGTLQLLSLPCSTGEEPFSMAIALLDACFPQGRFRIHGIDISARALSRAAQATYGKNSFRGSDLDFRDRHFTATPAGYCLHDNVRRQVAFAQGNLFDPGFLPGAALYDIIFCRNLLIYFDAIAQKHAIGVLTRLLGTNGVLLVGPSEAGLLSNNGFVSAGISRAFAFRKAVPSKAVQQRRATGPKPARPAPPQARRRVSPNRLPIGDGGAAHEPVRPAIDAASLDDIRRLADQGDLAEAARLCEECLRSGKASAETLHLLGLIREVSGRPAEAAECYRKTLYLDPDH